jgi:cell division protein FtsB
VERRRARALLLAAVLFATVVLLTALPWSTLANQHAQLTSASAEVTELQAQNHALTVQARELASKATQAGLARQDYGLVEPGQKAYDILPAPGTATTAATQAGHVPLDEPPVVPGSRRSEELLGAGVGSSAPSQPSGTPDRTTTSPAHGGPYGTGASSTDRLDEGGFWSRVAHTLEFWS